MPNTPDQETITNSILSKNLVELITLLSVTRIVMPEALNLLVKAIYHHEIPAGVKTATGAMASALALFFFSLSKWRPKVDVDNQETSQRRN